MRRLGLAVLWFGAAVMVASLALGTSPRLSLAWQTASPTARSTAPLVTVAPTEAAAPTAVPPAVPEATTPPPEVPTETAPPPAATALPAAEVVPATAATPVVPAVPEQVATTDVVTLVAWYQNDPTSEFINIFPILIDGGRLAGAEPGAAAIGRADFPDEGLPSLSLGDTSFASYARSEGDIPERWVWFDDTEGNRPATLVIQVSGVEGTYLDFYGSATFVSRDDNGVGGPLILALQPPGPAVAAEPEPPAPEAVPAEGATTEAPPAADAGTDVAGNEGEAPTPDPATTIGGDGGEEPAPDPAAEPGGDTGEAPTDEPAV